MTSKGCKMRNPQQMTENVEYWADNWNSSMANVYTKTGDKITIQTIYRHGKASEPRILTIPEYKKWLTDINEG